MFEREKSIQVFHSSVFRGDSDAWQSWDGIFHLMMKSNLKKSKRTDDKKRGT